MSSARPRQSVQPTPSRSTVLPPYQKPKYPINATAQRQLNALVSTQSLVRLKEHHRRVGEMIADAAGKINDQLKEREQWVEYHRARREKRGEMEDEDTSGERELHELNEAVGDMTKRLEEGMRATVDGQMSVERTEETLRWLKDNAGPHEAQEYQTQMSQRQSQIQSQRRNRPRNEDGDDEDMEDQRSSPGPTPMNHEGIALTGLPELFEDKIKNKKENYLALPLGVRYSKNNAYISFKRLVHDAQHGDDGVPLPHPDNWFTERGSPAPGVTATHNHNDSDDDIAIERETVSTRCPITLQNFRDPVTSTKCPHSFEKEAIMQMIGQSSAFPGTERSHKVVQCPVTGCEQMLSAQDVQPDPILVRKIRRIQKSNEQGSEDENSDEEEEDVAASRRRQADSVVLGTQQPPRSSMIIDMGEGSDDDEEEEEYDDE